MPLSVNHLSIVILKELTAEGREREQLFEPTDTSETAGQDFAAKEEDSVDKMSKVWVSSDQLLISGSFCSNNFN